MQLNTITNKIQSWEEARSTVRGWKARGERIVFTNGCFDIIHYGHVHYLAQARELGDRLVIGLNADVSVSKLKGSNRPINPEKGRALVLAGLAMTDLIVLFSQDTPYELIKSLQPDVLVKGGDWSPAEIVGSDIVLNSGGEVRSLPYIEGYSTTRIEEKIKKQA